MYNANRINPEVSKAQIPSDENGVPKSRWESIQRNLLAMAFDRLRYCLQRNCSSPTMTQRQTVNVSGYPSIRSKFVSKSMWQSAFLPNAPRPAEFSVYLPQFQPFLNSSAGHSLKPSGNSGHQSLPGFVLKSPCNAAS